MMGDLPKEWIIFWRVGPLQYTVPLLGECSRNLCVSVYQLALLGEAVFGFSEFFILEDSNHLPILWWATYERTCPHHAECSAVFDQKWHDPCAHPSYSLNFTRRSNSFLLLFPWMKKNSSKGNVLPKWRGETKNGRSTKRHQNQWVQKLFWAVEGTF